MTASPACDSRWVLLQADIADAVENLADGAALYREELPEPSTRASLRRREKAFQKFLQDGYSSVERALIRVLELFDGTPPQGRSWHSDLLRLAVAWQAPAGASGPVRPPFAPALLADLRLLLQFRHVAMHGYSEFDLSLARPAAEAAARVAAALPAAAEEFGRAAGLLPPA
ncbi:ribonuclease toxin HepT-like protein [Roseicella aquatilis]|uniref:HepT-like domain-containing protein n=1 Tax=Roseicella aquatilis TaxID=2527868 RepID=A0A4R4D480_9PROT|nr:hypothetical protein [Roseicella aquatilis]TCZ52913.1 hypothetical protein EXY23_25760 [Roseicella aquatilis]